jgi:hypothetical protein
MRRATLGAVVPDKEDLRAAHGWRQTQMNGLGAACFTLAVAILSPLLAAVFDGRAELDLWHLFTYLPGAALAAGAGALWHRELHRDRERFIAKGDDMADDKLDAMPRW